MLLEAQQYVLQSCSLENTGGIHTYFFGLTHEAARKLQVRVEVQLGRSVVEREAAA